MFFDKIKTLAEPQNDRLAAKVSKYYFRDALAVKRINKKLTPAQLQFAIFAYMPNWVDALMNIRNFCVGLFGFSVDANVAGGASSMAAESAQLNIGDKAGFLVVAEKTDSEIILSSEDKHIAFYLSIAITGDDFIVSTLVNQKTLIGRIYLNAILPFHYIIARSVINNAITKKRV